MAAKHEAILVFGDMRDGWITVATVANAAYVLYDAGWDGWGISGEAWAAIMLVVSAAITLSIIAIRSDIAHTVVIVWALAGIVSKQIDTPLVTTIAGIMTAIIVVAIVGQRTLKRQTRQMAGSNT